ncbi:pyridoxal-phosphate dependent enzyme [Candidatus Woesearchaeota archaeon]|nr:pyridoxal-phosphate dependent enzyme [Candidatus Woesearchaeota archaeon]
MDLQKGLECYSCGDRIPFAPVNTSNCCMAPYVPFYETGRISRSRIQEGPTSMYRYHDFLPSDSVPDSIVGFTTLTRAQRLGKAIGSNRLYIKDEDEPSTGTFKDRGVDVAGQKVIEFNSSGYNYRALGGTSTGNLSSAVAAKADQIGLKSIVLLHSGAEEELIRKAESFGAYVIVVDENYSAVSGLLERILLENDMIRNGVAWVNSQLRPIYSQGSKTIGFEIAEQLGWKAPGNIVYPVAAGLSLWQIYRGLEEFQKAGLIGELKTSMHAVQNSKCSPIVSSWEKYRQTGKLRIIPVKPSEKSLAETLSVGDPANGIEVLETIQKTEGTASAVDDSEIRKSMMLISIYTDLHPGPVSGAVVAAARRLVGNTIDPDEPTVLVLTDSYKKGRPPITGTKNGKILRVDGNTESIEKVIEAILDNRL